MNVQLPKRCFVSYSYDDDLGPLEAAIPKDVRLEPFPWEPPDPRAAISDDIVPRILECDGLIYLKGGSSEESGWVGFERDFALRNGKRVFSFDPHSKGARKFAPDRGPPLDLRVQVCVAPVFRKRAQKLLSWLRRKRSFDIGAPALARSMSDVKQFFEELANAKKLVVWLVDDVIAGHFSFEQQLEEEDVVLDVPEDWWPPPQIFARIDPEWQAEVFDDTEVYLEARARGLVVEPDVDLVDGAGASGLNWNSADELMVKITQVLADRQ